MWLTVHHDFGHEGEGVASVSLDGQVGVHVIAEALYVVIVQILLILLGVFAPVTLLLLWVLVG